MEREMEIAEWGGSPSSTDVNHDQVYVLVPPLSKPRKRKATSAVTTEPPAKKPRKSTKLPTIILPAGSSSSYAHEETKPYPKLSIKLKLGPKPEVFPCCLCVSMSNEGLLTVNDPPFGRKEALEACSNPTVWMAHEECANIIPETWVDEIENASGEKKKVVFGVDGVVKDRWNLVRRKHFFSSLISLTSFTVYRNVLHVLNHGQNLMARRFNAPEANA